MGTNLGNLLRNVGLQGSAATENDSETADSEPSVPVSPELLESLQKVVIRRTRKGRGGKTVTTVSGIPSGRSALAKQLRKALGVGSRVEGEFLVVHGDQVDRLATWFAGQGVKNVIRG